MADDATMLAPARSRRYWTLGHRAMQQCASARPDVA
jgi:hypothetical protein